MTQPLDGKIALVTGASRGIGRAIATVLAADGAHVAVHYGRNPQAADDVVAQIKAAGGEAFKIAADLTQPDAASVLFAALDTQLQNRYGSTHFDILVNNAGVAPFLSFTDTTAAAIDEIYAVNFRALFLITQQAVSRVRDSGRIISTSSIVARTPAVMVPAYSALKPAVDNLSRSLAVELGPRNITVNVVAPGNIETDMNGFAADPGMKEWVLSRQALKRVGTASDVADVVAFLAGPRARWVTGQTIEVGGGSGLVF